VKKKEAKEDLVTNIADISDTGTRTPVSCVRRNVINTYNISEYIVGLHYKMLIKTTVSGLFHYFLELSAAA